MLEPFKQSLSDGLAPVYVVVGEASIFVDGAVSALREAVGPLVGPPGLNESSARFGESDWESALSTARTPPMLGERRFVLVQALEVADGDALEAVEAYLANPEPHAVVVFAGTTFPKRFAARRKRMQARVQEIGTWLDTGGGQKGPEPFARERAASLGHSLSPQAARLLVELVGTDPGRIALEVDKVSVYVDAGAPIDEHAIASACSVTAEPVVWELSAGVAARDGAQALAALHRLLDDGESPHRLLGLISWQLRTVLRVAEQVRRGKDDVEIRRDLRIRHDLYRRIRPVVGQGFPGAAALLGELAESNRRMNRSRAGGRRVLEDLVVRLATR